MVNISYKAHLIKCKDQNTILHFKYIVTCDNIFKKHRLD